MSLEFPARAIQELAGHADLTMTQRYMHLTPAALDAAIRLLEEPNGPTTTSRSAMRSVADAGLGESIAGAPVSPGSMPTNGSGVLW